MNGTVVASSQPDSAAVSAPRVVSIDIFRGLTMAVMIFVNQLSGVPGLPWWTYHAHAQQDLMTYVDMVFPFFLFIVGMSLPLSVAQRLRRNPSLPALWFHVLVRVLGLLKKVERHARDVGVVGEVVRAQVNHEPVVGIVPGLIGRGAHFAPGRGPCRQV